MCGNPATSLLRQTPHFRQLAALPTVRMVVLDQCCYGSTYKQPTGLLTNMTCFEQLAQRCPGQPAHPNHPPLVGTLGTLTETGFGELPSQRHIRQSSVRQWQSVIARWRQLHHGVTHPTQWVGSNRLDPLQPLACKTRRAGEAKAAICGLMGPISIFG